MNTTLCAVGLALALTASSAWAQDQAAIEHRNAQARFDEGLTLANRGQYEEARVKFVQAYAVLKAPDVLYNLAVSEKKSAHPVESMRHFRTLVLDPRSPADLVGRSKKFMDDLGKLTAHVTVHAPDGADILVDGEVVTRAPTAQPVDVLAGRRVFAIHLSGNEATRDISLSNGESTDLTLVFPGGPPTTTTTSANTSPTTDRATANLPVRAPTPQVQVNNAPKWIAGGTLAAVGVAGLVLGGVFFGLNQRAKSDAETLASSGSCTSLSCTDLADARDRQATFKTLSAVTVIAGSAAVAAGAAILIWPPSSQKMQSTGGLRLTPCMGGTAFEIMGAF